MMGRGSPERQKYRKPEAEEPQSREYRDQTKVQGVSFGGAGPVKERGHQGEQHDGQGQNATEVPHAPAEAGDLANGCWGGNLREHGVVIHRRELGKDRGQSDEAHAENQEPWLREDEEAGGRQPGNDHGVHAQPEAAAPSGIRT